MVGRGIVAAIVGVGDDSGQVRAELRLDLRDEGITVPGLPRRFDFCEIVSTIHSAKGQEWRSVFVLNCVDG